MMALLNATLRLSCPILFAALGGLLCEAAGVPTLCLEGVLLLSAFVSASIVYFSQSLMLGFVGAMVSGGLLLWTHALLTQKAKANSIVSGMALNLLVAGITPLLCKMIFDNTTNTPSLPLDNRLPDLPLLHLSPLVLLALILPGILHFTLFHTKFGLHLRSAGDGPHALSASGISVFRVRVKAMILGGILASLGGVYLAIGHSSQFLRDMSAGRGFIALAAIILGGWRPLPTLAAGILFGFTEALQMTLQNFSWHGYTLPFQWTQCLPYLLTLCILVLSSNKNRAPRNLT